MEVKVNAIVIRAVDYKDNDRILTLYSLEKGKITAGIKGVKKAGAKLKFASEPFCFAEYILAEKNGRYTVTSASYYESFYDLRLNLNILTTLGGVFLGEQFHLMLNKCLFLIRQRIVSKDLCEHLTLGHFLLCHSSFSLAIGCHP